jgi:hypothetical protein
MLLRRLCCNLSSPRPRHGFVGDSLALADTQSGSEMRASARHADTFLIARLRAIRRFHSHKLAAAVTWPMSAILPRADMC